jgi:hypothetical protein
MVDLDDPEIQVVKSINNILTEGTLTFIMVSLASFG